MPYVINKTNGEPLLNLDDSVLDTSRSVGLVGRNYVGYGEVQNENFLHLMENFANNNPPPRPLAGQNWFDTLNKQLKIYDGNSWKIVGSAEVLVEEPALPNTGSLWFKIPSNILYIFDGEQWQIIGPESAEGFGVTRFQSTVLLDTEGNLNPVIISLIDNKALAIIAQKEFFISSQNPIEGFSRVFPGFNISSSSKIYGDLQGVAQSAIRLNSVRTINGVGFNGESNITIQATTERQLKRGVYLTGQNFDGSIETTWSVDASPNNIIGKVVARDSSGNFSAGTITADIVGNLQGNVTSTTGNSIFNVVTANQFVGASLSGNARTATRLQSDRKINGVIFNGTDDITITASASTLTGNFINPSVTLSSLTQVGSLTSLNVLNSGISVGSGNQLRILIDNQGPRISTGGTNLPLQIRISDTNFGNSSGVDIIPSAVSLAQGGDNVTSIIPSSSLNIGHPNYKISKIYANSFLGNLSGQADSSLVATRANNLSGAGPGSVPYQISANQTGFVPAGIAGQVLRSGGTGAPTWGNISFSILTRGQYLTGQDYDGFLSTTWNVDATPSNSSNKVVARDASGNFSASTITANLIGNVTGNVTGNASTATRLSTARTINGVSFDGSANITITATDTTKVAKTGDTMSGHLTLSLAPTNPGHATTKSYVDGRTPQYIFSTGNTIYTGGFTNIVGSWSNNSNFFDIFPPSGRTMSNLVAFIPSIAVIHYAGNVNADDSMRCTWSNLGDRIRVYVQNTEQRSTPAANYLAIWS
jgi:hypothetical protein